MRISKADNFMMAQKLCARITKQVPGARIALASREYEIYNVNLAETNSAYFDVHLNVDTLGDDACEWVDVPAPLKIRVANHGALYPCDYSMDPGGMTAAQIVAAVAAWADVHLEVARREYAAGRQY
ncbi:MAG TPA: hypothetical protein VLH56_08445 [Dissulfurispiraceae bacterium]|nr:hypothetical protein [Dissulfurispiraceae bacterium]